MRHIVAVIGVLLIVMACGGTAWVATHPSLRQFLVPGATEIQLSRQAWNQWQISYRAPGSPTTWYTDIPRQLEAQRWSSLDRVEYGSLTRTYSRAMSFGLCELWEWAYLTFDPLKPASAQIKIRRWITIPWWPRVL